MSFPAARVGDMHSCPMVTGVVPHVGGPAMPPGSVTVLIEGMSALCVGDSLACSGPPDTVIKGSNSVLVAGKPAARFGDTTAHGGVIVAGAATVMIGP